jgi:hypothetical protein
VRSGQLCVQVVMKLLRGCMRLALGTGAVATRMMDAVLVATALALREAVALVPALAVLDGPDDLAVRSGQMGRALQGLWCADREDVAQGGHGRRPCMRVLRRSSASSCPLWVRCQEIMVVASGGCPR